MKLLLLSLIGLTYYNAMCQFFEPYCYEDSTIMYYQNQRPQCDRKIEMIAYELNLVASQTSSNIEFTYSGIDTFVVSSKTYTTFIRTNKAAYLDTSYKYVKAKYNGGLNASYEVWFEKYFPYYSDSVVITFTSQMEFKTQKDILLTNPFYNHLSKDTLFLNTSKFWKKTPGEKKLFGREFLVFIPEKKKIKVFKKYFIRKEYRALIKRIKG